MIAQKLDKIDKLLLRNTSNLAADLENCQKYQIEDKEVEASSNIKYYMKKIKMKCEFPIELAKRYENSVIYPSRKITRQTGVPTLVQSNALNNFIQITGLYYESNSKYTIVYQKFSYDCFKHFTEIAKDSKGEEEVKVLQARNFIRVLYNIYYHMELNGKMPKMTLTDFKVIKLDKSYIIRFDHSSPKFFFEQDVDAIFNIRKILYQLIRSLFIYEAKLKTRTECRQTEKLIVGEIQQNLNNKNYTQLEKLLQSYEPKKVQYFLKLLKLVKDPKLQPAQLAQFASQDYQAQMQTKINWQQLLVRFQRRTN